MEDKEKIDVTMLSGANMRTKQTERRWWRRAWEKHKAKARLRAAAPNLLAACYGLWTVLVMAHIDWADPKETENCKDKTRIMDKARAAIYKAEGREC